jgi:hypothetical protein
MAVSASEALAAGRAVSAAIKAGTLTRQPCEECGAKAQAHHDDYAKPLDVRWLCRRHHRLWHNEHPSGVDWWANGSRIVVFRLTTEQYDKVAKRAAANKQSVSAQIRDLIKEAA